MQTKAAVRQLVKALESDPEYRESWKANIAMAFKDEWERAESAMKSEVHTIANRAADNFLTMLCNVTE